MNAPASDKPNVPTAAQRRLKYGLNVALTVVVAAAIVTVLNLLAYKFYLFKDLTALGQYSLSKQTRQVLRDLDENYTIATLTAPVDSASDPMRAAAVTQTIDLCDVYGRLSGNISVQHYSVGRDAVKIDKFLRDLESRYADELAPLKTAVEQGRTALGTLHEEVARQIEVLQAVLADESWNDPKLRDYATRVLQMLGRFDQRYEPIAQSIDELLESGMPDYDAVRQMCQARLSEMKDQVYVEARRIFADVAQTDRVPGHIRELLLQTNTLFDRSIEAIDAGLQQIDAAAPVEAYDELRTRFTDTSGQDLVVILGPDRVQIVSLSELSPDLSVLTRRESPELRFLGEERITGSLISMSLEQPPLVVFVSGGPPAIGPQGQFEYVAKRLRSVNFDVQQWSPAGQMMQFGQMMPPGPPPEPKPGQKAVWIVTPFGPDNPMNPTGAQAKQAAADVLRGRMEAGDSVMFLLTVNVGMRFGASEPIAEMLGPWGITPKLDQVVWREIVQPDRQAQSVTQFVIDQWPGDTPITSALQGMRGAFVFASPLILGTGEIEGVTRMPLVKLEGQRIWADESMGEQERPKFKEASSQPSFLVGVAAEAGDKRIIAIADPGWATDQITTYSLAGRPGEDLVSLFGAAFPANGELFVNSVYWLAGLENLIAASPRSQDIRRIEPMEEGTHNALRWVLLVGIPAAAFGAGIAMWMVRRRA